MGWVGRGDWNYSLIERCWVAVGMVEVTVGKVEVAAELLTSLGDRDN